MPLSDWLRLLVAGAYVLLFVAAMRSCGALERIADELGAIRRGESGELDGGAQ